MTEQDQIKALAELDGWTIHPQLGRVRDNLAMGRDVELPSYLTSYDAIIPLIQKQSFIGQTQLIDFLCEQALEEYDGSDYVKQSDLPLLLFKQTPANLSKALLRATGKWKE